MYANIYIYILIYVHIYIYVYIYVYNVLPTQFSIYALNTATPTTTSRPPSQ